ncbi:hypothetical protein [Clostridium intestinale]|uniref:Phage protein n=1 Tax=Clostridium intestinale URNW TaxID=1294142 RepID=U2NMW6_9CLOT|nr:hypothetical protein [Clostridium intestinale]ERK30196.1 hypothetical protein CINTURNW_1452 [Clostridium intestinale URNW]
MNKEKLKNEIEKNDVIFRYNNKYYSICYFRDKYSVYETDVEHSEQRFNSFEEMIENFNIEGKAFKDVIGEIILV